MKAGKFYLLIGIAAALCVIAGVAYQNQYNSKPKVTKGTVASGALLLPALKDQAGAIAGLTVEQDKGRVELARGGANNAWAIPSAAGYPADPGKITQLVLELSALKAGEAVTAKKEKYANFGLADGKIARGVVRLTGEKGKDVATLYLGDERKGAENPDNPMMQRGGGRYVRVGGDPNVYLIQENLYWLDTKTSTWAERDLLSVPRESIVDVRVDHPTTESLHLALSGSELKLDGLVPAGMQEKSYEVSSVAGALSSLRLEDVLTPTSATALNIAFKDSFTATAKDGVVYKIQAGKAADKNYIKIAAEYSAMTLTSADKATTVTEAAAKDAAAKAQKEWPEINKKHAGWVYQVDEWTFKNLAKNKSDLLEAKPEEKKPEGEQAGVKNPAPGKAEGKKDAPAAGKPAAAKPAAKDKVAQPAGKK